jgi:uncharacterized membrane protein YhaH (DUF805 family)
MGLLFSFFGRTGRGGFWLGVLMSMIFSIIAFGIAYALFGMPMTMVGPDGVPVPFGAPPPEGATPIMNMPALGVIGVGYLLAIWTSLATAVKRLHDRGKSGWWLVLMYLLSLVVVGAIWIIVELGILEGQEGPNKYGADPRAV